MGPAAAGWSWVVPLVRGLKTQLAVTWEGEEAGLGDTYQHTLQGPGCFETLEKPVKSNLPQKAGQELSVRLELRGRETF